MPTARELLEQADALMRRNRAAAAANEPAKPAPALPLGGPGIAPPLVSPRTIQREPIAPSVARTSLPVEPSESPFIVPGTLAPRAPEPASHAADEEAVVPVLTETVEAGDASPGDLDDVPLLTDVVEEIEMTVAGPVDDESVATDGVVDATARGEPSLWPEDVQGDASILGPAPDSVVVVPPPELAEPPRSPPAGRDPLGFDQPAPGFVPPEHAAAAEGAFDVERSLDEVAPELAVAPVAAEASREAPFDVEPALGDERPAADVLHAEAPHAHEAAPLAPARTPEDEARVRAIAEEIGMQVLQRIDIFTDTALRERLGERLKPVVERVSSELVDALNQHVGELLRAYVAEAIEREIETWRDRRDT